MKFHCWLKYSHLEKDGCEVDALDAEDAAVESCGTWNDRGTFAGDSIPDPIDVYVRNVETRELSVVEVAPEWDVSFFASAAKAAVEPDQVE